MARSAAQNTVSAVEANTVKKGDARGPQRGESRRGASAASLELREETRIVVEENADVGNAVFQHCDPVDAHSKSETREAFGIDARVAEHDGMDHPGAADLEPAGALANAAGCARTVLHAAED